ncbi:hypothetical protein PENTCL1PPCAC_19843, partial [Pristionchus entomophagus]
AKIRFVVLVEKKGLVHEHVQVVLVPKQKFGMYRNEIRGDQEALHSILHDLKVEFIRHLQLSRSIVNCDGFVGSSVHHLEQFVKVLSILFLQFDFILLRLLEITVEEFIEIGGLTREYLFIHGKLLSLQNEN